MEFKLIFFYVLAAILVGASLGVITARNPVHAAMFLVLSFFSAAMVWMLAQAEFLAIVLILVYVGAVMVLFLFVVMMLDINFDRLRQGFWSYLPLGALIGILMILEMSIVLGGQYFQVLDTPLPAELADSSNTKDLGLLLYTQYTYPDQVAAAILLVAIIAAVVLTLRGRKDNKRQVISDQVAVKAADRLRVVKMDAVKPQPAVTDTSVTEAGNGAAQ
ncbi:MAG: NADH-quinone oxidoreductase subunit J [Fluviibacter sp.]